MKNTFNKILLGSALVVASIDVSWAGPSPDLMNAARTHVQAAKAKVESTPRDSVPRTRNVTAGQSTVAVPMIAFGLK